MAQQAREFPNQRAANKFRREPTAKPFQRWTQHFPGLVCRKTLVGGRVAFSERSLWLRLQGSSSVAAQYLNWYSSMIQDSTKMMATIYFDGGSRGNPGPSYGSWQIILGQKIMRGQWEVVNPLTCNEAEYLTLWLALHELLAKCEGFQGVEVFSDSQLLVNQVSGRWKTKHPRMRELREKILLLLRRSTPWTIVWNSRWVNVQKFGH